jgi:hypothetical protein
MESNATRLTAPTTTMKKIKDSLCPNGSKHFQRLE